MFGNLKMLKVEDVENFGKDARRIILKLRVIKPWNSQESNQYLPENMNWQIWLFQLDENLEYRTNIYKKHEMEMRYSMWDQYLSRNKKWQVGNMGSIFIDEYRINIY